jgi:hypothetical protein
MEWLEEEDILYYCLHFHDEVECVDIISEFV